MRTMHTLGEELELHPLLLSLLGIIYIFVPCWDIIITVTCLYDNAQQDTTSGEQPTQQVIWYSKLRHAHVVQHMKRMQVF